MNNGTSLPAEFMMEGIQQATKHTYYMQDLVTCSPTAQVTTVWAPVHLSFSKKPNLNTKIFNYTYY